MVDGKGNSRMDLSMLMEKKERRIEVEREQII